MKHNCFLLYLFGAFVFTSLSCLPAKAPQKTTLSSAQKEFLKICKEELQYDVSLIPAGKTIWIYVPLADGITSLHAAPKNQAPKAETKVNWSINFLEAKLADKTFAISFDITPRKRYDQNISYQNKYTDDCNKRQRDILNALTRAYFDVGQKNINAPILVGNKKDPKTNGQLAAEMTRNPLTFSDQETAPEFFVIVFADTRRGVAIRTINYFEDMRMALSNPPAISNEEYIKRYIYDIYGDEDLIGDKTGKRLKTEEIQFGDFLAKQIENRIKFQFTQSGFPPTGEVQDEIWGIIAETCRLYNFKDFEKIKLINLQTEKESTYNKSQL